MAHSRAPTPARVVTPGGGREQQTQHAHQPGTTPARDREWDMTPGRDHNHQQLQGGVIANESRPRLLGGMFPVTGNNDTTCVQQKVSECNKHRDCEDPDDCNSDKPEECEGHQRCLKSGETLAGDVGARQVVCTKGKTAECSKHTECEEPKECNNNKPAECKSHRKCSKTGEICGGGDTAAQPQPVCTKGKKAECSKHTECEEPKECNSNKPTECKSHRKCSKTDGNGGGDAAAPLAAGTCGGGKPAAPTGSGKKTDTGKGNTCTGKTQAKSKAVPGTVASRTRTGAGHRIDAPKRFGQDEFIELTPTKKTGKRATRATSKSPLAKGSKPTGVTKKKTVAGRPKKAKKVKPEVSPEPVVRKAKEHTGPYAPTVGERVRLGQRERDAGLKARASLSPKPKKTKSASVKKTVGRAIPIKFTPTTGEREAQGQRKIAASEEAKRRISEGPKSKATAKPKSSKSTTGAGVKKNTAVKKAGEKKR